MLRKETQIPRLGDDWHAVTRSTNSRLRLPRRTAWRLGAVDLLMRSAHSVVCADRPGNHFHQSSSIYFVTVLVKRLFLGSKVKPGFVISVTVRV